MRAWPGGHGGCWCWSCPGLPQISQTQETAESPLLVPTAQERLVGQNPPAAEAVTSFPPCPPQAMAVSVFRSRKGTSWGAVPLRAPWSQSVGIAGYRAAGAPSAGPVACQDSAVRSEWLLPEAVAPRAARKACGLGRTHAPTSWDLRTRVGPGQVLLHCPAGLTGPSF